jgi:aldehyde:ferredoxin oxidoreductase
LTSFGGFNQKIAVVDLTEGKIRYESPDKEDLGKFVGGRGLGAKQLWDSKISGEQNFIGMYVGPLTGSGVPLANRLTIVFHSPLTNTIAYANTGGYAGTGLKLAGFDGIVLLGEAANPKYLLVKNGVVTLLDAGQLWGKRATETMNLLREKHGDVRVLSIGPAGENLVKYANVVNDAGRASGVRHGAGCVLGGKRVKAVAILSDYSLRLPIANREEFRKVVNSLNKKVHESLLLNRDVGSFSVYGTPLAVEPLNSGEALPVRNYSLTHFEGATNLTGKKMSETILVNRLTCNSCAVQCRRETAKLSKYDFRVEGPDYAQISSLGSNCGVWDLEAVAYLNYLCYETGLDPIETGNLLAIYAASTESHEVNRGLEPLKWGDADRMIGLIELIAQKEGEGAMLAEGADYLINELGDTSLSTAVKGITIQNADPRVEPAWGLLNATENSGASLHIWVYPDLIHSFQEIVGLTTLLSKYREDYSAIAKSVIWKQNLVAILDSLQVCAFSNMAFGLGDYANALNAVTGWEWSADDLIRSGERIFNLERKFNNFVGVNEDVLPPKFLQEKITEGTHSGKVCNLEPMLVQYYLQRGWTHGVVDKEKLEQLQIA